MATHIERTRRLWNVEEYQRMVETGILTRGDHVELIHGEVVQMTPMGRRHSAAVAALHALFVTRLGERVVIWSQGSLPLPPGSMPEPDLLVLGPRADFYREADVRADDVLLLVEVAEISLRYDRHVKAPLYAAAGIRENWIVDVDGGAVETYRAPSPEGYRQSQRFLRGSPFSPVAFPDLILSIADILG
jgi:Uma2 family endonuclease